MKKICSFSRFVKGDSVTLNVPTLACSYCLVRLKNVEMQATYRGHLMLNKKRYDVFDVEPGVACAFCRKDFGTYIERCYESV